MVKYLKKNNIKSFVTENNEIKAAIIERFNRTLKNMLFRWQTHWHTDRYIDKLQEFVENYNNTPHSTIKNAPNEVDESNAELAWLNMTNKHKPNIKQPKARFRIEDEVILSYLKQLFQKGYEPGWTERIYTIEEVKNTQPRTYKIRDAFNKGEKVTGSAYEHELIAANNPDKLIIEDVLKTRRVKGRQQSLIKWLGYPESDATWEWLDI